MNEGEIALATQLADSVREFFGDEDGEDIGDPSVDVVVEFADGTAKLAWEFDDEDDEDEEEGE